MSDKKYPNYALLQVTNGEVVAVKDNRAVLRTEDGKGQPVHAIIQFSKAPAMNVGDRVNVDANVITKLSVRDGIAYIHADKGYLHEGRTSRMTVSMNAVVPTSSQFVKKMDSGSFAYSSSFKDEAGEYHSLSFFTRQELPLGAVVQVTGAVGLRTFASKKENGTVKAQMSFEACSVTKTGRNVLGATPNAASAQSALEDDAPAAGPATEEIPF